LLAVVFGSAASRLIPTNYIKAGACLASQAGM